MAGHFHSEQESQPQVLSTYTRQHGYDMFEFAQHQGAAVQPEAGLPHSVASEQGDLSQPVEKGPHTLCEETYSPTSSSSNAVDGPSAKEVDSPLPRAWRASWLRPGALLGLLGLVLASMSMLSSLAVLMASDGQPTNAWSAPPSTYLAICTAIANTALRYACIQGVAIAWWYRASKPGGATLSQLHHDWRSGTTLRGAVTAGRHTGLLAIACVLSTLVVLDGPLLQRASTVMNAPITEETLSLNVSMAQELPRGFGGTWRYSGQTTTGAWSLGFNDTIPTPSGNVSNYVTPTIDNKHMGSRLVSLFNSNDPVPGVVRGCPGTCQTTIRAPALAITSCASHSLAVDYFHALPMSAIQQMSASTGFGAPFDQYAFLTSVSLNVHEADESITLVTGYSENSGCNGTLHWTTCTLRSAVGEYATTIRNNLLSLDDTAHPKIIALAENTAVSHKNVPAVHGRLSTLAPVVSVAWAKWDNYIAYYLEHGVPVSLVPGAYNTYSAYFSFSQPNDTCSSFTNPQEDALADLNRLMFYEGAIIASSQNESTLTAEYPLDRAYQDMAYTTTAQVVGDQAVYQSDYWYFFAAAFLQAVCTIFVAMTYYGWWTLGRPVSFSPLEVAKAFEAPALAHCNSNSSGRDIAKTVGSERLQYGAALSQPGYSRLAFSLPQMVRTMPANTVTRFDV